MFIVHDIECHISIVLFCVKKDSSYLSIVTKTLIMSFALTEHHFKDIRRSVIVDLL